MRYLSRKTRSDLTDFYIYIYIYIFFFFLLSTLCGVCLNNDMLTFHKDHRMYDPCFSVSFFFFFQNHNQNCLLVICLNDNHLPGPVVREVSP